ncbi:unnamed protein product [Rotaria sp. Silwood2]|nr:unnamed protein product [Rotaria sp. Silwood2]CAF4466073.1 unnamed protein product [Rotaria sp. Silwood2]
MVKCNTSTVKKWLARWKIYKYLGDKTRSGTPRITTQEDDEFIVDATFDVEEPTNAGLRYCTPLSKPLLTQKHQQDRLQWAKLVRNQDWNNVIATDETTFRLNTIRHMHWQFPGNRTVRRTVKFPLKINVWGCMTAKGFGKIILFKQNLHSHFLCNEIYQNGLLPTARNVFGRSKNWLLMEDKDPKHRSTFSRDWKAQHDIKQLPWAAFSPDMNPMENLWALLKIKVSMRKPSNIKELIKAIKQEWNLLPKELAENLMFSMKYRIESVIDAAGDYTMY